MKRRYMPTRLFLVLLAGAFAAFPASAAEVAGGAAGRRPLALVGSDTLTIADLDAEISATLTDGQGPRQLPEIDPAAALRRLTQDRLLEQEGYRIGADESKAVQNQVHEMIRSGSVRALMDSVSALPPGTVPGKADSLLGRINVMRRYSHILVPDEAVARSLRDSLSAGVPFADLARRHSTDANAPLGGDLGWAAENAYVDEFEAAARKLGRNQVAGPVKTKFGWHLVTLTDTRTDTLKSETMAKAYAEDRERQRRTEAVRKYVTSLRTRYGVVVNDTLLAGLDYASKDPAVIKRLESSDAVLAVLPTGRLTVAGLTRKIRFQYFHGLADHPDAPAIRNSMFDEWLTEALLTHEAHRLGMDRDPGLLRAAKREERRLVREEVVNGILKFEFKPADAEVRGFYGEHRRELTPPPRVKVQSALVTDEAAARRFRDQLEGGTAFSWLAQRTPEVKTGTPPLPPDWVDPERLGLKGASVTVGAAFGPQSLPDGWGVGQVVAVEKVEAPPLDKCRDRVVRMMRAVRNRQVLEDALAKLETGTRVTVLNGAQDAVAERIGQWRTATAAGGAP